MATLAIDHIIATPDVCGGKPRISGTRMKVRNVAMVHKSGMTADEIVDEFGLTPAQVYAALAYYYDHQLEIDQDIADEETFAGPLMAEGHTNQAGDSRDKIARRMKELKKS